MCAENAQSVLKVRLGDETVDLSRVSNERRLFRNSITISAGSLSSLNCT